MVKTTQATIKNLERDRARLVKTIAGRERALADLEQKLKGSLLPAQRADFERRRAEVALWLPVHQARLTALDQTLAALQSEVDHA